MDRGTEGDAGRRAAGPGAPDADTTAGRVPPAVAVVDRAGLVSHWSSGARRLFGVPREHAVGRPAVDLLPVSGALPEEDEAPYRAGAEGCGPWPVRGRSPSRAAAGRARLSVPGHAVPRLAGEGSRRSGEPGRIDVLWWAYPLVGPGGARLLVFAADAGGLRGTDPSDPGAARAAERLAPASARHAGFPGAEDLARRLPGILPGMSAAGSARIAAQALELGYPDLDFGRHERVPDGGVPRRAGHRPRRVREGRALTEGGPVAREPGGDAGEPEHTAPHGRPEFLLLMPCPRAGS
ncbi:PAS domain-containing protein [Streptomyces tropicalis]|uniref:PAS domain-containing protein n=1 Tax=Streptomyces tropicalis TaxID=3034234 RepID=UPI0028BD6B9B|nr:PAS domain-containing protein [Streptomyces tropicalis]